MVALSGSRDGGRPEEQLVVALEGSGWCTVLARRSLWWRRSASVAEGGA
jgi:hypothetical protein